eukprot:SAG11_NODE_2165_length_3728_cov_2.060072_1_plen_67_part_10
MITMNSPAPKFQLVHPAGLNRLKDHGSKKLEFFFRSNMCTLLRGKDTKEKTNNEEDVERVADESQSE